MVNNTPRAMFKDRLNEALIIREMKAVDLCKRTGIHPAMMSQYRSGLSVPKAKRLMIIANALNVQETWLLGYDVSMEKPKNDEEITNEIYRMIALLKPQEQELVLKQIKALIDD